jgi:hypothetical protein
MSKTTISILIMSVALSMNAQVKTRGGTNDPKPISPRNEPKNNSQSGNNNQGEHWGNGSFQGNITIGFGNGPYYGNPYPYNNYYYNGYNWKKATRNSLRAAKYVINDAVAFDSWNDIYSPLVAKAIRHYNYARQLYWWGNYQAAYNHAERARYLAWYSLQYFQDPGYYNGGAYQPDPYSDPYDPYYKKGQGGNEAQRNKENRGSKMPEQLKQDDLDGNLPGSDKNDREILKSFDRSEDKDE